MGANGHTNRELGPDERRERRKLRREKQRAENIGRAQKMHVARLTAKLPERQKVELPKSAYVGCSGWFYWKWRGPFYPAELPTPAWFNQLCRALRYGRDKRILLFLADRGKCEDAGRVSQARKASCTRSRFVS